MSGKMSQALYNFPPEIETSPLTKSLEEKLTISIWQVEDKYEIIWITGHWSRVRGNRVLVPNSRQSAFGSSTSTCNSSFACSVVAEL